MCDAESTISVALQERYVMSKDAIYEGLKSQNDLIFAKFHKPFTVIFATFMKSVSQYLSIIVGSYGVNVGLIVTVMPDVWYVYVMPFDRYAA